MYYIVVAYPYQIYTGYCHMMVTIRTYSEYIYALIMLYSSGTRRWPGRPKSTMDDNLEHMLPVFQFIAMSEIRYFTAKGAVIPGIRYGALGCQKRQRILREKAGRGQNVAVRHSPRHILSIRPLSDGE